MVDGLRAILLTKVIPRRFNVKPTNPVLALTERPLASLVARWGLIPSWFKGSEPKAWQATTFNARLRGRVLHFGERFRGAVGRFGGQAAL